MTIHNNIPPLPPTVALLAFVGLCLAASLRYKLPVPVGLAGVGILPVTQVVWFHSYPAWTGIMTSMVVILLVLLGLAVYNPANQGNRADDICYWLALVSSLVLKPLLAWIGTLIYLLGEKDTVPRWVWLTPLLLGVVALVVLVYVAFRRRNQHPNRRPQVQSAP